MAEKRKFAALAELHRQTAEPVGPKEPDPGERPQIAEKGGNVRQSASGATPSTSSMPTILRNAPTGR